ncbi:YlxM family DNA-binding protein [Caproicibacter sp.]|uniref:YlxM family DNA-binding protein n=1 Tax=Caproicibacter sp. TaxID=2814884 RepID=UPI003988FDF6
MAKNLNISLLLDFYGSMLTEKQRRIVEYYYDDDLSLSEIAENEGITRQGVRDFVKRSEGLLLEMEQKLGLVRRFREMMDGLQKIDEAAGRIREYNEHYIYAREIDESAKQILEITRRLCE